MATDQALVRKIQKDAAAAVITLATGPLGQEHLVVNGVCMTCDDGTTHPTWKES